MAQPKVYILTAVHNGLDYTKKLLRCIDDQTYKNIETYLIDDGSTDGTSEYVENQHPAVKVIRGNGNLWWTASLNLGIKHILKKAKESDLIWIVNNDCVFTRDTLKKIVSCFLACSNKKCIVGPTIIDKKTGRFWDSGVLIDWKVMKFTTYNPLVKNKEPDALSTKGTLYPIRVFKDLKLFDAKHFPQYFSDYEYSIRAKNAGYHLKVCPEVKVFNQVDRTGIEKTTTGKVDLKYSILVGFSRRSKFNIFTQLNIIRFVCPGQYRLRNYFILIGKVIRKTLNTN